MPQRFVCLPWCKKTLYKYSSFPFSFTYVHAAYCYRPISMVCLSACRSVTVVSPAKTAEPIDMSFGLWTWVGPKTIRNRRGAHWRHRAKKINRPRAAAMRPFCQITLNTCYHNHHHSQYSTACATPEHD